MELLSPAGSFDTARAAFAAGADAVYLGLDAFSARADADNFSPDELRSLMAYARSFSPAKKVYVTFNTLLDDDDMPEAFEKLQLLDEIHPDGLIVQDLGVVRLVKKYFPSLALHASTQLVAHNLEGVLALRDLGFTRVVLARELPIEDIRSIALRSGVEIEVFVHGALCYSISGLCLFSAMERKRSGNKGKCAYCCRMCYTDGTGAKVLPFSMRDLRLDHELDALAEAGVVSLKIEGRMKSPLYVSTVTSYYRDLLDGTRKGASKGDLETVFSRRTTSLYAHSWNEPNANVIDNESLGHLGTPIGTVKRVTKDREGRSWLRFHTSRALEKHDGLQFRTDVGKPVGFGIAEMRTALSRNAVFTVKAGTDVEILIPDAVLEDGMAAIRQGATVYCSASEAVKRAFPIPSFRPSDYPVGRKIDINVELTAHQVKISAVLDASRTPQDIAGRAGAPRTPQDIAGRAVAPRPPFEMIFPMELDAAQHPERTFETIRKSFSRMGTSNWRLGKLEVTDGESRFVPVSSLNEMRRAFIEKLDAEQAKAAKAQYDGYMASRIANDCERPEVSTLKMRLDQPLPDGYQVYDEIILALDHRSFREAIASVEERGGVKCRLALPVWTKERDFARLQAAVKAFVKAGYVKWEVPDLGSLRLLKGLGVDDIVADWTLYAFNREAVDELRELGVKAFVASPENAEANIDMLERASLPVYALERQSTPLFISVTKPAADDASLLTATNGDRFVTYGRDGLWVTIRPEPREFVSRGMSRTDISWDA